MNADPVRLLRRNATAIQAAFAALWFVRGGLAAPKQIAALLVAAAVVPLISAVSTWRAIGPIETREVMHSEAGRALFRPVTWMTTAQLVASVVLPWWAGATGHADWVLASIALTIGPLLIGLARPLAAPVTLLSGGLITVAAVALPIVTSGVTLAVSMCSALGALLTASVVSLWATAVRLGRIGVAPG